MPTPYFAIVELSGHIIDSLTLAKVIDKIQALGCQYQINDIQIGEKKSDFSTAVISIWTQSQEALDTVLDELKPYGALPVENTTVQLAPCPQDGVLPDGAYLRMLPPTEILYEGRWLAVERHAMGHAIVFHPDSQTAEYREVRYVKQGDLVVLGKEGVKMLPTLGEMANATAVTG